MSSDGDQRTILLPALLSLSSDWMSIRCCYITVDSAMAASQNGFCSYKLSIHKNQYYADNDKKYYNFYLFILLSEKDCETRSFYDTFLECASTVLWRSGCKIHHFVAEPNIRCLSLLMAIIKLNEQSRLSKLS